MKFACEYCGVEFTPEEETPEYSARGEDKTLWFCTAECKDDWWAYHS